MKYRQNKVESYQCKNRNLRLYAGVQTDHDHVMINCSKTHFWSTFIGSNWTKTEFSISLKVDQKWVWVTWSLISKRNWGGPKLSLHAYASRDSPPSHTLLTLIQLAWLIYMRRNIWVHVLYFISESKIKVIFYCRDRHPPIDFLGRISVTRASLWPSLSLQCVSITTNRVLWPNVEVLTRLRE